MEDYIIRMQDERKELETKWDKLIKYVGKHYDNLDGTEIYLMQQQIKCMKKYIMFLDARIDHAKLKEQ